jgi:hypothetical protein
VVTLLAELQTWCCFVGCDAISPGEKSKQTPIVFSPDAIIVFMAPLSKHVPISAVMVSLDGSTFSVWLCVQRLLTTLWGFTTV